MKIKFKLESDKMVKIIGVEKGKEKEIGRIFTPSSSAENITNAVQICGFDEAFDLWGCAVYAGKKYVNDILREGFEQKKDIQLKFSMDSEWHLTEHTKMGVHLEEHDFVGLGTEKVIRQKKWETHDDCMGCFNYPCTCEVKIQHENPYTVKREQDLFLEITKGTKSSADIHAKFKKDVKKLEKVEK